MDNILKIRYVVSSFDYDLMLPGSRSIIDIFPTGIIETRKFHAKCRKCYVKTKDSFPVTDFQQLCEKINTCIAVADRVDQYIDDSDAVLYLYYPYGREQKMPRGLGNGDMTIAGIINDFLAKYIKEV